MYASADQTESVVFEKHVGHFLILKRDEYDVKWLLERLLAHLAHLGLDRVLVPGVVVDRVGLMLFACHVLSAAAATELDKATAVVRMHEGPFSGALMHLLAGYFTHVHGVTTTIHFAKFRGVIGKLHVGHHQVRVGFLKMLVDEVSLAPEDGEVGDQESARNLVVFNFKSL